ncbi:unnamed protein product [Cuscuta epithymum]|uniref:Low-temperature-induced 65 kDa protein n=3 Tax=Cuscuta epithymum TaxID=186058 RepID=A0AAV0FNY8_9ASTE|nr:unnamed protein product [Cuscuta epithymum]
MDETQILRGHDEGQTHGRGGVVRPSVIQEEESGGHDEHHHDKKSVLKKVKEKAKKIKDTLKHHGHAHDHDGDESLEDDDEMEVDPDVHGGHIGGDSAIGGTAIRHKTLDDFGHVEKPIVKPTSPRKDHHGLGLKDEGIIKPGEELESKHTRGITRVPLHKHNQPSVPEPTNQSSAHRNPGDLLQQQPEVSKIGAPVGLEEDPQAPSNHPRAPSNYQSKTIDPTGAGGVEAGISPLIQSFENMEVGKPESRTTTGSHDQFAPDQSAAVDSMSSKDTESIPKRFDPSKPEDLPVDPVNGRPSAPQGGSYAGRSAEYAKSAAIAVAEKLAPVYERVAGAGSAVMEKLPLPGGSGQRVKETSRDEYDQQGGGKSVTSTVKEKLAPVYDKVTAAGSTLMSKVQGPGIGQAIVKEGNEENVKSDKGVSMKEYLAEKLKPGEEDKALSDMISGTLSRQKAEKTGETGKDIRPMGRVTESKKVAERLGPLDDTPKEGSEEKGMVDMLKGAVNSWLGRDDELRAATHHTDEKTVGVSRAEEVHDENAVGERRRLQESGQ